VIHAIEAQGVASGSVKHIKHLPVIVDCGVVLGEPDEEDAQLSEAS
jgi:hypothetical protein